MRYCKNFYRRFWSIRSTVISSATFNCGESASLHYFRGYTHHCNSLSARLPHSASNKSRMEINNLILTSQLKHSKLAFVSEAMKVFWLNCRSFTTDRSRNSPDIYFWSCSIDRLIWLLNPRPPKKESTTITSQDHR
jgi:hypothetical protein